ncbi:MAG: malonyl-CoA decarboxylase [Alphaproteobacteria bacterium]|nr:malonyl-CoA decarboxylase [Alphaproteobacteria bacterium]
MSEPEATITDTPDSANQSADRVANRGANGNAAPHRNLRETPDQSESFWHRTLRGARRVWSDWAGSLEADLVGPTLSEADAEILLRHMRDCIAGEGGEVSARARAARLGEIYWGLDDQGRRRFLTLIVENFGPDEAVIEKAIEAYRAAPPKASPEDRAARIGDLRAALDNPWIELLTQFNALPQGVKFLVDMRADILGFLKEEPSLAPLDRDMQRLLASWFDIGFLSLTRITWESPAALLEKLIEYEAVHEIRSWTDLRNRLDSDRRLFAFFHPRMPMEPLIFVEVALVKGIAGSVQALLDEDAPVLAPDVADTAIFYSISNSQAGLKGVSFGNFLIKRVVEELKNESPNLRAFATLSPIPGFKRWLDRAIAEGLSGMMSASERRLLKSALGDAFKKGDLPRLLAGPDWRAKPETADALRPMLMRLCARYLLQEKRGAEPLDPVARFHLNNGAQLDRINWLGDVSDKGMRESAGMMVNYLYKLSEIERNHERYAKNAFITASSQVKDLL